jgi:predicted alpha-1,2-mannosidase
MQKLKVAISLAACQALFLLACAQPGTENGTLKDSDNLDYIDPTIGNVGQLLQPTRPTVQLPNEMMRMFPVRSDYMDDQITSFPSLIVSHRLGEVFAIKPSVELSPGASNWNERMTYDHDLEITRPWYYSTYLIDDDITVEFTPGKKAGIYRFEFPQSAAKKSLLFNAYNNNDNNWNFISADEITATETYHGDIKVYMYGVFSSKGISGMAKQAAGRNSVNAWISFPDNASSKIEFKYAVSYISPEQAKKNFDNELRTATFEELKKAAEQAWQKVIDQVKVEGGTKAQKRSFYTALYRCYERMVNISEDKKYYSGFDKKIHESERPFYVDDWTWDTYLAHHPLRIILDPAREEDILNSYVDMYTQSGWMPTFPVLFGDHACMNGFHSSIMFLDAYRKGLRNFDVNKAYEGMFKNAMQATMVPWRNGPKCALDDIYLTKGYFPGLKQNEKETEKIVDDFEKRQSVAVTLGASYDDWAVGQLAGELKKEPERKLFDARAGNYKNLWNRESQFFLPKDAEGNWINIDPKFDGGKGGRDYYDENNGWTYLWQVQHDVKGLIALMGDKKTFENKLD